MGACYSVELGLSYPESAKDDILKIMADAIKYVKGKKDSESIEGCVKFLMAEHQGSFLKKTVDTSDGKTMDIYSSDFDATYSWEDLIIDTMEELAPLLNEGSFVYMSADDCEYTEYVRKGSLTAYRAIM